MTGIYTLFKNPGPRHPFSAALMCLAAVVDGRTPVALVAKLNDTTFRFVSAAGYEIEVTHFSTPELGEWVSVGKVVTPEDVEVLLTFVNGALTDVFLPLIKSATAAPTPVH